MYSRIKISSEKGCYLNVPSRRNHNWLLCIYCLYSSLVKSAELMEKNVLNRNEYKMNAQILLYMCYTYTSFS